MKKLLFITGSRGDFNKISDIIIYLSKNNLVSVLLVDMHNEKCFGSTGNIVREELKSYKNICVDSVGEKDTSKTLNYFGWLVWKLDKYYNSKNFDMTFVHGDRMSALAGAIVSNYHNVPVCHIEAGDVSGNIDECIRHSISKFSQRFLVTDDICRKRVLQLGEKEDSVYCIGNTSSFKSLSNWKETELCKALGKRYAILIYHPIYNKSPKENLDNFNYVVKSLKVFDGKILLIHCNNDPSGELIIKEYKDLKNNKQFVFRKNVDPKEFYSALENASFIIGNSSCGVCEAPFIGIPTIDVGERQNNRYCGKNLETFFHIKDMDNNCEKTIIKVMNMRKSDTIKSQQNSLNKNLKGVFTEKFFNVKTSKVFIDR